MNLYTCNLASVNNGTTTYSTSSGRRLTGIGGVTYNYDESGLRISKSRTGGTSNFIYAGDRLIKQSRTISSVTTDTFFNYDESGLLIGLSINNKEYFYLRDITGNIHQIIDITGSVMVDYSYNAWGVVSSSVNSSLSGDLLTQANLLLVHNPYVYKGYFYDSETGYYYLKSRYYDPRIHRFISADKIDYLDPQSLSSLNLYVYCGDNPVMMMDENGTFVSTIIGFITGGIWGAISAAIDGRNIWQGALHGAVFGGLTGLFIDISVATGGIGGMVIAGISSSLFGFSSDVSSQMLFEGKTFDEVNWGQSIAVGILSGLTGMAAFGISSAAGSWGKTLPKGLSILQKMTMSLKSAYTPTASWFVQSYAPLAYNIFTMIPGFINQQNSRSTQTQTMAIDY